ncbi:MAG TPA: ABC transporter ATP-binding protein, partial [Balneolaceae bacterium]|nr:ABC transporter ATP-binding protein [Balneolaceae bacterium]
MKPFKLYRQHDQMDCGPTCLRMVAKHHGRKYSLEKLRKSSGINREGVSLLGISEAAENIGFRTVGAKLSWEQLKEQVSLPCIVFWGQEHFVVVYKIKRNKVYVADPAKGKVTYPKEEFLQRWLNAKTNGQDSGIALLLYTTPKFYELEEDKKDRLDFSRLLQYLLPYKNLLFQ